MHHDPWAVSSKDEFDLTDFFEEDHVPATPYTGTGWIRKAEAQMFIHGCKRPVNEVHAQAYKALRALNTVEPHLGLDRSLGQVCIDDVRSQPTDEGYKTAERTDGALTTQRYPVSPAIPRSHSAQRHGLLNS